MSAITKKIVDTSFTTIFAAICIAYIVLYLGGRFLNLSPDEVYFLHLAYGLKQGWLSLNDGISSPYDLYILWLSLMLEKNSPDHLWNAIFIDSAMHLVSVVSLLVVVRPMLASFRLTGSLVILAGLFYFFTIGRLGEHRPDYLSIWFFSLAVLLTLRHIFSPAGRNKSLIFSAVGAVFALAICFSPRAAFMLVVVGSVMLVYLSFTIDRREVVRILSAMIIGSSIMIWLVWLLTDFSLLASSIRTFINAESENVVNLTLEARLTFNQRFYQVLLILFALMVGVLGVVKSRTDETQLLCVTTVALSLAQLSLILYDRAIFGYGYSYYLVGFILAIVIVSRVLSHSPDTESTGVKSDLGAMVSGSNGSVNRLPLAQIVLILLAFFFAYQISFFGDPKRGWVYGYKTTVDRYYDIEDQNNRLYSGLLGDWSLLPALTARISLCKKHPDAEFIMQFHRSPICLKNAYEHMAFEGKKGSNYRRFHFPNNQEQVNLALQQFGTPKDKSYRGGLIMTSPASGERIWVAF